MTQTTYTPTFADDLDARASRDVNGSMPQLPDAREARAWVLSVCEGRGQAEIAGELGVTQPTVCRMVDRATRKIETLIAQRWITRDALVAKIRRAVGLAART